MIRLPVIASFLVLFTSQAFADDVENGEAVFKLCRTCHQIGDTAKNLIGPVLNGIVGRKAGSVEGFTYSDANKDAGAKGLVWSEDILLKYLENPAAFMPKTNAITSL